MTAHTFTPDQIETAVRYLLNGMRDSQAAGVFASQHSDWPADAPWITALLAAARSRIESDAIATGGDDPITVAIARQTVLFSNCMRLEDYKTAASIAKEITKLQIAKAASVPAAAASPSMPAAAPSPALPEIQSSRIGEYQKENGEYEKIYSRTKRTIIRWKHAGAPLDDPAAMPAWIAGYSGRSALGEPPAASPVAGPPAVASPAQAAPVSHAETSSQTLAFQIQRHRVAAENAWQSYEASLARQNQNDASFWIKQHTDLVENLRKLETSAPGVARENATTLDRAAVAQVLREIAASFRLGMRSMLRRARPRLAGVLDIEADRIWSEECDALLSQLAANPLTKEPAAAE